MIYDLGKNNSIVNQFVSELRDAEVQKDSMRFRRNLERLGEIFAYEISKKISYKQKNIVTPLGELDMPVIECWPVLATILRAGLPFHQGFLNIFDKSESAFISAYRKHHKDGSFTIQVEYVSCPNIEEKTLIVIDPMLATGSSLVLAIKELFQFGMPKNIHIATAIASSQGIDYVRKHLPHQKTDLWVAAIDEELTAQAYIVPGLGDAGDLSFGNKE
ncbi:MAG: uracil phosphoribosyltransferase [Bacteroidales bacterium]|jgi:uracil phosphoribosyltransferase|nr:uracil phosphoribosyltransferase [Bacteroidales bacterium]